jgi:hypothetical protein
MSDYDQEQYALMQACINKFEQGNLDIKELIDGLEGLLSCLEETSKEWSESFKSEWWTLEQTYAVAAYREQEVLSPEDESFFYRAIDNIKLLLQEKSLSKSQL